MAWVSRFFIAVVLLTTAELYLLIWVSEHSSWLVTVALCATTGITGGYLVRKQGIQTFIAVQQQFQVGILPGTDIISGLILLIIGAFLLTPGFITDSLAFLLLIPSIRDMVSRKIVNRFQDRVISVREHGTGPSD